MATNNPVKPPPGFTLVDEQGVKPPPGFTLVSEPPEKKSVGGFVENIGSSGGRFLGDIVGAVAHPIETGKAAGKLVGGAAQMAIPGEQGLEPNARALVDLYKQRYGGWENLAKTLYEDPVGVLADLSTLATGGGAALKGLGMAGKAAKVGRAAELATTAGKVASTVGEVTDPLRGLIQGAKGLTNTTAEGLYQSAVKPSLSAKNIPGIPGKMETGLAEAIPVSESGAKKIASLIDDLDAQVKGKAATGAAQGKTVNPELVARRADATSAKFSQQVTPQADLASIAGAKGEFLDKYAIRDAQGNVIGYKQIPLDVAQAEKTGTYTQLRKKYGELGSARIEAEKALARGLKEEIENAIPEVKGLNARESKLLALEPAIIKAVARSGNWEKFAPGIYGGLGGIGAGMATSSPEVGVAAAALLTILRDPNIKSRLAIAISRAHKAHPEKYAKFGTALSRVQEYIDSLVPQAPEEPAP